MPKNEISQDKFEKLVTEWKQMDRSTDSKRKNASAFYDKEIFPTVIKSFIERHRPGKEYDGMILTVGLSPQPLVLSIKAINPVHIAFLYTPEAKVFIEQIQEQTGYPSDRIDCLEINGTDVKGIYDDTWKFARDSWGNLENVAVDITGGKTSMAAGAALAAAVIPADICYVDGDYLKEFRMPEPGSEFMRILEAPNTLLRIAL